MSNAESIIFNSDSLEFRGSLSRTSWIQSFSDNGKIVSSKITSVSFGKQKKLTREIKKAKILGLI